MTPEKILILLLAQLIMETANDIGAVIHGDNFEPYEQEEELQEVSELTLQPSEEELRIVYNDKVYLISVKEETYQF